MATYNLLWTLSDAIDEYKKFKKTRCVNLKGYLNCTENFKNHSILFDTASDIIVKILGMKMKSLKKCYRCKLITKKFTC